jgi:ribosomal protein L11 methyltransferase
MKKYKEFTITSEPFNSEILSGVLWEYDISGLNEDVNCMKVFTSNLDLSVDDISQGLQRLKEEKLIFNYTIEENVLEEKNWNLEWEQSINVIEVSDKIVIKPTFRDYQEKPGQIVLVIDPKMSFGTGEHQTTKLMLILLEKNIKGGESVLDVGSGTGVLAIAALKLGAIHSVAIDIDEWCLDNAKENSVLNNVEDNLDIRQGEIKDIKETGFDIVLANIQKDILLKISEEIFSRVKPGGKVFLSGLLTSDEDDIKSAYSGTGFQFIKTLALDPWIAIVFTK